MRSCWGALTVALMVVHADGIDFPLITRWLRWRDFIAMQTAALVVVALWSIYSYSSPRRDDSKAHPILSAIALGVLGTVAVATLYNSLCGDWFVGETVCMGRRSGPPWNAKRRRAGARARYWSMMGYVMVVRATSISQT